MRLLCATVVLACAAANARADDAFPYVGTISADEVYVRSGPGRNYYPTAKLQKGAEVEIYRHDPGGWYAVRPPQGSFSWVSARHLEPVEGEIFAVRGDRVASRVGSQFSDIRQVIQVRLEPGEELIVLDSRAATTPGETTRWYKVSPPAGEFRWVHSRFVDRAPGAAAQNETAPPVTTTLPVPATSNAPEGIAAKTIDQAAPPVPTASPAPAFVEVDKPRPAATPPAVSSRPPFRRAPETTEEQLDDLELQLSRMIAVEPTAWSLAGLRAQAEDLHGQCETAIERGKVQAMLNKIARCEQVHRGYMRVAQSEADAQTAQVPIPATAATFVEAPLDASRRFDAIGELRSVAQPDVGTPTPHYALVDPTGAVLYYLTSAPGVNLQNYLGRKIGVTVTMGYMPTLRARHVTARRVTVLSDKALR